MEGSFQISGDVEFVFPFQKHFYKGGCVNMGAADQSDFFVHFFLRLKIQVIDEHFSI